MARAEMLKSGMRSPPGLGLVKESGTPAASTLRAEQQSFSPDKAFHPFQMQMTLPSLPSCCRNYPFRVTFSCK